MGLSRAAARRAAACERLRARALRRTAERRNRRPDSSCSSAPPTPTRLDDLRNPARTKRGDQPYRGMQPGPTARRASPPHGGGLLVGQDTTRPSGKQIVVLARDPGGRFHSAARTARGRVAAAGEGGRPARGELVEAEGAGAVADAAVENGGHTEAFFGALGRDRRTRASIALGRHALDARAGRTARRLPGLASRSSRSRAPRRRTCGCSARPARQSGLGPMLFKRVVNGSGEGHWQARRTRLGAVRAGGHSRAERLRAWRRSEAPAQPLTVIRPGRVDRRQPAGASAAAATA